MNCFNLVLIIFCLCFVCSASALREESDISLENGQSHFRSKTYFDFLEDVSTKLQRAKYLETADDEVDEVSENLIDEILQVYQPLIKYGTRNRKGTRRDQNLYSASVTDKKDESTNVLHYVLESLGDVAAAANKTNSSSRCINDTGRLITGLLGFQNWSIQFFDATGKPGPGLTEFSLNFVGNYKQCREARAPDEGGNSGFDGNYCAINIVSQSKLSLGIGACLPSTCSSEEVTILGRQILKNRTTALGALGFSAECRAAKTEVTTATIAAIIIVSVIGLMMVIGTIYDILFVGKTNSISNLNPVPKSSTAQNDYQSIGVHGDITGNLKKESSPLITHDESKSTTSPKNSSAFAKLLLAFSVYTNGKKLLCTNQPPGALGSIHGIRFLSMSWVVLCHVMSYFLSGSSNAAVEFPNLLERWSFMPIINGFVSVDTFFTLSGLLTSYLTLKEMMRKNTWKIKWSMFYFHRFWRLTPPYMLALVIVLGFQQYWGQGPLWVNTQPIDKLYCEKNWWTNLLYINNLVKMKEGCFGHSWYLANDMQFFILSPLMLIPFFFHRMLGFLSCFVFLFITFTTTGVLSSVNKWPTTTISLKPNPERAGAAGWMENYYVVPWCRIGPFIVGIAAGYILAATKGRPFRMPGWMVTLGWTISAATGLAIVYGLYGDIKGENVTTVDTAAFYNAVSRAAWGACVSWVIIACSAGYGGPVNALLSWSPFVVLGRLTYMSYLIHISLANVFFQDLGALLYLDDSIMIVVFLGILLFVNMAAFVCVLGLESPMIGLEKTFLRKGVN